MKFNKLFHSVDVHTAGKALRIITSGVPFLQGKTMLEKQHYFSQHFDHIRKVLLEEPRGHKDLQGCLITPPVSADAHFGALLLDQEGACSTMEGHDMMGIVGNGIELGYLKQRILHSNRLWLIHWLDPSLSFCITSMEDPTPFPISRRLLCLLSTGFRSN